MRRVLWIMAAAGAALLYGQTGGSYRLIRSLSGVSGKVVGNEFVFDSTQNRFEYPAVRSFIVYFEWDGPPGDHKLTGIWKGPDGRVISLSRDIEIHTENHKVAAYWKYDIAPGVPSGIWQLEVKANGEPAGTHAFELVLPAETAPAPPPAPPKQLTADDIYAKTKRSLVWIHSLDETQRRTDTGSGFVLRKGLVATAFQVIDSAASLELEFADGRKVLSDRIAGWSRMGDWALVAADTGDVPALEMGDAAKARISGTLLAYSAGDDKRRSFGAVDLTGRATLPAFGERLQIAPALGLASAGGPLLNDDGAAIAVIGGAIFPGARTGDRNLNVSPALFTALKNDGMATPVRWL